MLSSRNSFSLHQLPCSKWRHRHVLTLRGVNAGSGSGRVIGLSLRISGSAPGRGVGTTRARVAKGARVVVTTTKPKARVPAARRARVIMPSGATRPMVVRFAFRLMLRDVTAAAGEFMSVECEVACSRIQCGSIFRLWRQRRRRLVAAAPTDVPASPCSTFSLGLHGMGIFVHIYRKFAPRSSWF